MKITALLDNQIDYSEYRRETIESVLGFLGGINALFFVFIQYLIGDY